MTAASVYMGDLEPKIKISVGLALGQGWLTQNSWEEGEGEEDKLMMNSL